MRHTLSSTSTLGTTKFAAAVLTAQGTGPATAGRYPARELPSSDRGKGFRAAYRAPRRTY
ncbi:hypothetical protein [Streptomyces sp. NPDC093225]|uniref:hypothetical protein n=1 Tax=Streptomyces sp. NPDC093225 TaxID=3366034 RepID=UPI0037FA9ECE